MSRAKKGYVSSLQGLVKLALVQAQLTREEETKLAKKAQKGDRAAQDQMIRGAAIMAEKYGRQQAQAYGMTESELIAEGMVGLGMALRKFKPEKKIRFATYAIWWVRVYVDRHVKEYADVWESANGTKVRFVSADAPISAFKSNIEDEDDNTIMDTLRSEDEGGEVRAMEVQVRDAVHRVLEAASLSAIERGIIKHRLLDDTMTLEELGAQFGVSRERIRQLEIQLKPKLREIFEKAGEF